MKQLTDIELIAEFRGVKYRSKKLRTGIVSVVIENGSRGKHERYRTSWDWLMPVVKKIEKVLSEYNSKDTSWLYWNNVFDGYVNTNIELTFESVVEFIRWHKTQNQTN